MKKSQDGKVSVSLGLSILAVLPSVAVGSLLLKNQIPLHYAYFVGCTILMLAVFDFATVIFIDHYRDRIGKFTIPALTGTIAIIFMYVIAESFNRFYNSLGYVYLAPFVAFSLLLIYLAIFREKNLPMKLYLSLNSVALMLLWAMGAVHKITMPF